MPVLAIVGAGPNLGLAVARRFGAEGFSVGLVARNVERLARMQRDVVGVKSASATADLRVPGQGAAALRSIADELGTVDVLLYSPLASLDWIKPVAATDPEDLRASLELSVLGAAEAVNAVLPAMRSRGSGSLLFTTGGAAVAPSHERASSAVSNAAEVSYARLLHEALSSEGIHAAHLAIVGGLGEGLKHAPADVAETLWRAHTERDTFQHVLD